MAIKTRETLYSIFTQGAIPSQSDYKDLIDSTLNRRDDRFFGLWRKGTRYCSGDVVIYDKSLYVLNRQEHGDCLSLSNASPDDGCYCSTTPPPEDENNWCLLQLAINDDDFEIVYNDDGSVTIIFQLNARVGIGTDQPEGRLEVSDHLQHGRLLLEPDDNGRPAITLVRLEEGVEKGRVKHHLGSRAEWSTDGLGYAFWRVQADASQTSVEQQQLAPKKQLPKETPPVLLFITSNERARPASASALKLRKGHWTYTKPVEVNLLFIRAPSRSRAYCWSTCKQRAPVAIPCQGWRRITPLLRPMQTCASKEGPSCPLAYRANPLRIKR